MKGDPLSEIEWVWVEPGSTYVGSDNRALLSGGPQPRHESRIGYRFQISREMVSREIADKDIGEGGSQLASESEWQLAFDRGAITGQNGNVEELADRIRGSYWGKICDGRPWVEEEWVALACRGWFRGKPKPVFLNENSPSPSFVRLVRRENDPSPLAPRLPINYPNRKSLVIEEVTISVVLGIIPSFIWAYFNASPGYINEGWLNLIVGGLFIGILSSIFWRPRQKTWWAEGSTMSPRR